MSAEAASSPQDRAAEHRRILVERLVTKTKASLLTRDPVSAFRNFQIAHRLDPQHVEANFYLALSRLLSWPVRQHTDFRSLGFRGPSRRPIRAVELNPLRFMATLPHALRLPTQLSNGAEIQQRIAQKMIGELQVSAQALARVPDTFSSSLPLRNPFTGSPAIEIDGADVALLRAAVHVALATCYLSQVYDVDAEVQPLVARAEGDESTMANEILSVHPRLLRLRDAEQARRAKTELLAAIDAYLAADTLLRAETDDQQDDLFSFSPLLEDVRKQDAFRQALVDLRNSLTGLSDSAWTLTVDQLLHVGDVFDRPIDLRALETGPGIQEMLLSHLLHQSERALVNLRKAPVTFSERIDPATNVGVPDGRPVEIDYGDLLALQAGLESLNAAVTILAGYNAELSLPQTAVVASQQGVDLDEAVLNPHPALLRVQDLTRLGEGRILGIRALQTALDALAYARSSDDADQTDDVIPVDRLEQAEAHLRPPLEALRQSLQAQIDPDPEVAGDEFLVNLVPVFDGLDPRQVLPPFDGVKPLPAPDPTFGGVLPDGLPHGEP